MIISALGTGTDNSYTEIYSQGGRKISRADLADFMIKQVEPDDFIHQKPGSIIVRVLNRMCNPL